MACAVTDISKGSLVIVEMEINFIDLGQIEKKIVHCNLLLLIPENVAQMK